MYQEHLCVLWKHIFIVSILMGKNDMSSIVSGYSYLVAVNFFGFLQDGKKRKKRRLSQAARYLLFFITVNSLSSANIL